MGNSTSSLPPLKTVTNCETSRFMGKWFVIGLKPTIFEKTTSNEMEEYTLVTDKGHDIDIKFTYNNKEDPFTSKVKSMTQKGWVQGPDKANSGEWIVSPFFLVKFQYPIIELDDVNYDHCVVGYPSRDYAWIMSRKPVMDDELYDSLCAKLKDKHSYDLEGLRKVPQKWTREERSKRGLTEKDLPDSYLSTD